ncbi:MAG TPA: hypothetical protein VH475_28120, partial [Tepidisphaeraceae bacterium]
YNTTLAPPVAAAVPMASAVRASSPAQVQARVKSLFSLMPVAKVQPRTAPARGKLLGKPSH